MQLTPRVVDLFHGDILYSDAHHTDPVADFRAMASAGLWGIIHKATQGLSVNDPAYARRVNNARLAGLLTGAYHFNTGDTVQGQLNHFFDAAKPDYRTLMALDWEDNRASQMTLSQAVQFLQMGKEMLGRPLWIYSGNRVKEQIVNASEEVRHTFAECPFWLCEYGPVAKMNDSTGRPLPWVQPTLWQRTGDGIGPGPHTIPGILTNGIDLSVFTGSRDDLVEVWTDNVLTS